MNGRNSPIIVVFLMQKEINYEVIIYYIKSYFSFCEYFYLNKKLENFIVNNFK